MAGDAGHGPFVALQAHDAMGSAGAVESLGRWRCKLQTWTPAAGRQGEETGAWQTAFGARCSCEGGLGGVL